jgi:hypothetical protein
VRPLNKEPVTERTLNPRPCKRIYPEQELAEYRDPNRCPANGKRCDDAVWMFQTMFLSMRADTDQIAATIRKIQTHAAERARS